MISAGPTTEAAPEWCVNTIEGLAPSELAGRNLSSMVPKPPHSAHRAISPDLAARLAAVVERTADRDPSGCILRPKCVNKYTGYASVSFRQEGERHQVYAHRVMWTHLRGPIPSGMTIDHLCRVRNCVNVEHMEVVAIGVNILRSDNPAARNARKVTCKEGHRLTAMPDGRRRCAECRNARAQGRAPDTKGDRAKWYAPLGDDDPRHGSVNGYTNYKCRCAPCREAMSAYYYAKKPRAEGEVPA